MGKSVKQIAKALNSWTVEGGIAALCWLLKWSAALLTTIGFPYQCYSDISHDFAQVCCNRPQRSVWVEVDPSWPWCLALSLSLSSSPSLQALNHDSSKSACQVSWSTMESNVQFPHKNFQHEEDICRCALCTTTTMNRLPCVNDTCHTFWCTGVISDAPASRWLPWKLRQ